MFSWILFFTGGSYVTSPTGTLQSDRMQYQTQYNNQYQTQTLPHNMQTVSQSSYESRTLPHQSSYQQQVGVEISRCSFLF